MSTAEHVKILFLSASPSALSRVRVDHEQRSIQQRLNQGRLRDRFEFICGLAARTSDLSALLLKHRPSIVHFSGHSTPGRQGAELVFEGDRGEAKPVACRALADLFGAFSDTIRCVVLNACHSNEQATAITEHIDYVVGTKATVPNRAAQTFSERFYGALAEGQNIPQAFRLACVDLAVEGGSRPPFEIYTRGKEHRQNVHETRCTPYPAWVPWAVIMAILASLGGGYVGYASQHRHGIEASIVADAASLDTVAAPISTGNAGQSGDTAQPEDARRRTETIEPRRSVVKLTGAGQNVGVNVLIPSYMSGAEVLVNGRPARVVARTLTVVTVKAKMGAEHLVSVVKSDLACRINILVSEIDQMINPCY